MTVRTDENTDPMTPAARVAVRPKEPPAPRPPLPSEPAVVIRASIKTEVAAPLVRRPAVSQPPITDFPPSIDVEVVTARVTSAYPTVAIPSVASQRMRNTTAFVVSLVAVGAITFALARLLQAEAQPPAVYRSEVPAAAAAVSGQPPMVPERVASQSARPEREGTALGDATDLAAGLDLPVAAPASLRNPASSPSTRRAGEGKDPKGTRSSASPKPWERTAPPGASELERTL